MQEADGGEEVAKPLPLVDTVKALAAAWAGVDEADTQLHQATYSAHLALGLNSGGPVHNHLLLLHYKECRPLAEP